jgi:hypothetical protein
MLRTYVKVFDWTTTGIFGKSAKNLDGHCFQVSSMAVFLAERLSVGDGQE